MKSIVLGVYKSHGYSVERLEFSETTPEEIRGNSQDWEQFCKDMGQGERLARLLDMPSRKRSPKLYRLRNSEAFRKWSANHPYIITFERVGTITMNYDARFKEYQAAHGIREAAQFMGAQICAGACSGQARIYPKSNAGKPEHLRRVYLFRFEYKPAAAAK